ncbi:XTP/dITP diphosphatase [Clostridium sediminicola]|uniref:XTP/dITP diphosphatase n=1 Tax=Clostridium sediminicola TaxID=3114879 RepID=UPI0031F1D72B
MKKLIVASNNQHKIEEIKNILSKYNLEVVSLKEAGIDIDIEETGVTFEENVHIKAKAIKDITNDVMVLADDSGLMVDALGGEPGVYSARYSGEHGDTKANNRKLLSELKDVSRNERNARFVCAMELIINEETIINVIGEVHGYIIDEETGDNGFGYDPLFYYPQFQKTFAQMSGEEKNSISHRGRALKKLEDEIKTLL